MQTYAKRERQRETHTERQRQRERERERRERERQIQTQTETEIQRETERETETDRQRQTDRETDRQTETDSVGGDEQSVVPEVCGDGDGARHGVDGEEGGGRVHADSLVTNLTLKRDNTSVRPLVVFQTSHLSLFTQSFIF